VKWPASAFKLLHDVKVGEYITGSLAGSLAEAQAKLDASLKKKLDDYATDAEVFDDVAVKCTCAAKVGVIGHAAFCPLGDCTGPAQDPVKCKNVIRRAKTSPVHGVPYPYR
jgi:hypothetical protein